MRFLTIWLSVLTCTMACGAEVGKLITVDQSKFGEVYPAVWFSPTTGELAPVTDKSEVPPEPTYEVWIEPRDPEFGFLVSQSEAEAKKVGFAFVGKGAEVFERMEAPPAVDLDVKLTHLTREPQLTNESVFYCRGAANACLIMVEEISTDKESITFRWKPLNIEKGYAQPDAAPEPPPAAPVQESSDNTNPKRESEAPADGGGR